MRVALDNIPDRPFLMCRIISHNEEVGTIELSLFPDTVNEEKFMIAVEVNSKDLLSANIKKFVFVGLPQRPNTNYYSEVNKNSLDDSNGGDDIFAEKLRLKKAALEPALKEELKGKQVTEYSIELPVKDLKFEDGLVSFKHYVAQVESNIHFQIANAFIKKEYDSIKNYFSKALGSKKFEILIHVESIGGRHIIYSATSPHVEKIDNSLFELVEDLYIEDSFLNNSEDEIYSLEERAKEAFQKTGSENIKDEKWLLNKLFTKQGTKHYYHLRYLSSKHLSEIFNLHLTGKPISFIFLIPNQNDYCLVWETYLTEEATYMWRLNNISLKNLQSSVQELINKIKWLRRNNKLAFLKTKPDNFKRIEHKYNGDDMGFKKWKEELEGFLSQ